VYQINFDLYKAEGLLFEIKTLAETQLSVLNPGQGFHVALTCQFA